MSPLTLVEKAFFLKRTLPFRALNLDTLLSIADKLGSIHPVEGSDVFLRGEEAFRLYFLVGGTVFLSLPNQSTPISLQPGDFFGDEALFSNVPRAYAASAGSECHLLTLSRHHLHMILSECPDVALGFLESYATLLPLRYAQVLPLNDG